MQVQGLGDGPHFRDLVRLWASDLDGEKEKNMETCLARFSRGARSVGELFGV